MITKLILSSLFAVSLSSGLIYKSENLTGDALNRSLNTENVVKAVAHNGEILPYYELPVVEITGKRNVDGLVRAAIIDGKVVPVIDLQEVVITPASGSNSI